MQRLQEADPALTQAVMSRLMGKNAANKSSDTTATQPMPAAASLPNPVLKFLNSREEPKVISMKGNQGGPKHNMDLRKMHQAGGYDITEYEQRNWSEIKLHIDQAGRA